MALREAPSQLVVHIGASKRIADESRGKGTGARNETERRMYAAVRKAGRATKSRGTLGEFSERKGSGASATFGGAEYQVMGVRDLERLVGAS